MTASQPVFPPCATCGKIPKSIDKRCSCYDIPVDASPPPPRKAGDWRVTSNEEIQDLRIQGLSQHITDLIQMNVILRTDIRSLEEKVACQQGAIDYIVEISLDMHGHIRTIVNYCIELEDHIAILAEEAISSLSYMDRPELHAILDKIDAAKSSRLPKTTP